MEKLNLALEMRNNVMLYLDDIQHTDPEFLQKFISLCDGTRRIEGVWKGKTKKIDVLELKDGSLLIADDKADAIYRVTYSN